MRLTIIKGPFPLFLNTITALDFDIMLEIFINIIQMIYFK